MTEFDAGPDDSRRNCCASSNAQPGKDSVARIRVFKRWWKIVRAGFERVEIAPQPQLRRSGQRNLDNARKRSKCRRTPRPAAVCIPEFAASDPQEHAIGRQARSS